MAANGGMSSGRLATRDLVYVAVFAAAWSLVETSLGSYLHAARVPFRGAALAALGMALALSGRAIVGRRGVVLMIGAITAILRLLSLGGVVLWPLLGILMESLLAELVLVPFRRPGPAAFALAGAAATLWTVIHPFVTQGLLAGSGLFVVYGRLIETTTQALPFMRGVVWLLLAVAVAVPLALGVVAGLAANGLGGALCARLGRHMLST